MTERYRPVNLSFDLPREEFAAQCREKLDESRRDSWPRDDYAGCFGTLFRGGDHERISWLSKQLAKVGW